MMNRIVLLVFATLALAATSGAWAQCPSTKVISSRPWERGSFGEVVQIKDDVAVVADVNDQTFCLLCSSGAVHTFRRIDGSWQHEARLFHSRISERDGFGAGISLDGPDRFAASAPGEGVLQPGAGAIYIFEHDGEAWREVAEIVPVEPQWANVFGGSLLLRGDTLIVGQPKFQIAEGFVGAAWVYRLVDGRWEFVQKLMAPDPRPNAQFGNALAMDGEWLMVGAFLDDERGRAAGAVYAYRRQPDGTYSLGAKLFAPGHPDTPVFGADIGLDGERMAVGASSADGITPAQGAVYVFELEGGEWSYGATLQHDDPVYADALGVSVALHGDVVVAGAPRQEIPGRLARGAAYAFQRQVDGSWRQAGKIPPPEFSADFGRAVATDGASVIVGAPDEPVPGGSGAAHIYDLPCILCRADLDGDGELTFFDFLAFQNLFAAGDPGADFDGDGALTFFDFLAFQTEFAAGCG